MVAKISFLLFLFDSHVLKYVQTRPFLTVHYFTPMLCLLTEANETKEAHWAKQKRPVLRTRGAQTWLLPCSVWLDAASSDTFPRLGVAFPPRFSGSADAADARPAPSPDLPPRTACHRARAHTARNTRTHAPWLTHTKRAAKNREENSSQITMGNRITPLFSSHVIMT